MLKYLHEFLCLLHDFMSEGHRGSDRHTDDGSAADEAAAASSQRTVGSAASPRRAR
jgi:hypothetical protein